MLAFLGRTGSDIPMEESNGLVYTVTNHERQVYQAYLYEVLHFINN